MSSASLLVRWFSSKHVHPVTETNANVNTGPLLWGPLSEAYGRKRPLCAAFLLFTVFQVPVAVAKNIATVLAARLICGTAGSAAFSIRKFVR